MGCGRSRRNPVRIALITPEYPGYGPSFGIGRYVADLAESLRTAGHTVLVLAATDEGGVVVGVDRSPESMPRSLLRRSLVVRPWLMHELELFQPDVVEAPNWGGLTALLPSRWPLVVRLSTSAVDAFGPRRDLWRPFRILLEKVAVHRAHGIIADSCSMGRRCVSLYSRNADVVIPHAWRGQGVSTVTERGPDVLFVGRWEPRKGVDVLMRAWPEVLAAMPQARLHLVGSGQPKGLAGPGIQAHGHLPPTSLASLRKRCKIQVVPSRFESFGLVVLEAWAAGLVPVVSAGGALPEVVGDAGMVVPVGDSTALSRTLLQVIHRDGTSMVEAGLRRLAGEFSPILHLQATLELYRLAISRQRTGCYQRVCSVSSP